MRTNVPDGIRDSAFELDPNGLVRLYVLTLPSGPVFRLTAQKQVTWQSNVYESIPCVLTEFELESDGKANRPTFSFANPEGLFTSAVGAGLLENAVLVRYRVLPEDIALDRDFALVESMRISQVLSVTRGVVVAQLRDAHDGPAFQLPARAFFPPEFPHVKL